MWGGDSKSIIIWSYYKINKRSAEMGRMEIPNTNQLAINKHWKSYFFLFIRDLVLPFKVPTRSKMLAVHYFNLNKKWWFWFEDWDFLQSIKKKRNTCEPLSRMIFQVKLTWRSGERSHCCQFDKRRKDLIAVNLTNAEKILLLSIWQTQKRSWHGIMFGCCCLL